MDLAGLLTEEALKQSEKTEKHDVKYFG